MNIEKLIKALEERLEDYRRRHFANKSLHLDVRASEVSSILEIVRENDTI